MTRNNQSKRSTASMVARAWSSSAKRILPKTVVPISNFILVVTPFIALMLGQIEYERRGYAAIGGEVVLIAFLLIVAFAMRSASRVSGNSTYTLPVPAERFTEVDYEMVSVEKERLNDLMLYMADLEDWFEDNGYY